MKKVVLTLALLSMASLASADPIVHLKVVPQGSPPEYPNLQRYYLYLVAQPGYTVLAYEGRFDGSMWQEWLFPGTGETADLTLIPTLDALRPGASERDTHLMGDFNTLLYAQPPHEQEPAPSPSGVGQWFGNSEIGVMAMGFDPSVQGESVLLAQIVIPFGGEVLVTGTACYKPTGTSQYITEPLDELLIPEPTSLSLLALGTVLALVRRRRS